MRVLWIAVWLIACVIGPAHAQEMGFAWVLEEEFTFLEFHDPGVLVLEDATGTQSELEFGYAGLTYKVVAAWNRGKTIQVAYSPTTGTEIVDPHNGARYAIADARPRIDALDSRCRSENPSTAAWQDCDAGALAAWDIELNRAYQTLMRSGLADSAKNAIRTAQREWLAYRDATLAAVRAYLADGSGGSIRRLQASNVAVGLTRSQTRMLLGYDAPPPVDAAPAH